MSAEATAYVWKHSPYKGASFALHLAMADVVNDSHGFVFWMEQSKLAAKARTTRETANRWIHRAVEDGFIEVIEDNSRKRKPSRFRFLRPHVDPVWNPVPHVTRDHMQGSQHVTTDHTTCDERSHVHVTRDHTELEEELNGTELLDDEQARSSKPGLDKPGSRPEVDRLCSLLSDLIEANGSKRPRVTELWRKNCRLLLDNDGRSEKQVETIIRWSQNDSFWQQNIHSMPTLRKQFDKLRMRRNQEIAEKKGNSTPTEVNVGQAWMRRTRKATS